MPKKLTTQEFVEKAKFVHGDKYDYGLVEYINNHTKVKIVCPTHGEFLQIAHDHINGCICKKCAFDKFKIPLDVLIKRFVKKHGEKYDYSKVTYKDEKTKIIITCKLHGDFKQTPGSHMFGSGCPKCNGRHFNYSNNDIIKRFKNIHGDKYDYSKINYINANTKITIINKDYNTEHLILPYNYHVKCTKHNAVNKTDFLIKQFEKIHGNKYNYDFVEYKGDNIKVSIVCNKHGLFLQTPNNHLRRKGCPICKEPTGETQIKFMLLKFGICFKQQKRFIDCYDKYTLPFDFYLLDKKICIEFHGIQHYEPIEWFGGEKMFKSQQKRDKIKMEYCKNNKILLVVIKYNENIEEMLLKANIISK